MKVYSIHWKKWVDFDNGVHPKLVSGTTTYYQPDKDGYCSCAMCQYYKWYEYKDLVPDELFEI